MSCAILWKRSLLEFIVWTGHELSFQKSGPGWCAVVVFYLWQWNSRGRDCYVETAFSLLYSVLCCKKNLNFITLQLSSGKGTFATNKPSEHIAWILEKLQGKLYTLRKTNRITQEWGFSRSKSQLHPICKWLRGLCASVSSSVTSGWKHWPRRLAVRIKRVNTCKALRTLPGAL